MAQERPSRLAEWVMLIRKNAPILREQLHCWATEVRDEPRLLWETGAIRYATYGVGAIAAAWLLTIVVTMMTPPPPADSRPEATTADYHVVCKDAACRCHFVINRKFGFDDFPVECLQCRKLTGVSARACFSKSCQGRWTAPVASGTELRCLRCGEPLP